MDARVPDAVVARVDVGRIDVGQVSLGDIVVGQLRVDDARVNIRSGQALLRDVRVRMRLEFSIDWWIGIDLWFDDFSDSGTATFRPLVIPLSLGDWEIPGLRDINLDIAALTGTNVQTSADPIGNLQLNGLAADDVRATDVLLPTPGFTLAGLGLTSLSVADVAVPAARVGGATVGQVGGAPLTLPSLRLRGLTLPSTTAQDRGDPATAGPSRHDGHGAGDSDPGRRGEAEVGTGGAAGPRTRRGAVRGGGEP